MDRLLHDKIPCLDHGYVQLVDYMGSDEDIVAAARMSTGRGFVSWEAYKRCRVCDAVKFSDGLLAAARACAPVCERCDWQDFPRGDLGMLEFMYRNGHSTPFEFGELHVEVQAPIMVFREWHRHRTQSFSEFSARYSQMPNLHYVPTPDRIQKQSTTNRQGSGEVFDERFASVMRHRVKKEQAAVYAHYDEMVGDGVAKEVARLNTPVSRYSKMRAKTDLRNWLAFLKLRMAPTAQWEIRQYANAIAGIVQTIWPRTYALFEEHDLGAVRLSRTEVEWVRQHLHGTHGLDNAGAALLERLKKSSS